MTHKTQAGSAKRVGIKNEFFTRYLNGEGFGWAAIWYGLYKTHAHHLATNSNVRRNQISSNSFKYFRCIPRNIVLNIKNRDKTSSVSMRSIPAQILCIKVF
jgi:hypothetical protein